MISPRFPFISPMSFSGLVVTDHNIVDAPNSVVAQILNLD